MRELPEALKSGTDPDAAEAAAPSAAPESETHASEKTDGAARAVAIIVIAPDIQVFHLDNRITVGGFVKASRFLSGDRADERDLGPGRKGGRVRGGTVNREKSPLRIRPSLGRRIIVLDRQLQHL
jgi:hypothetical protein